MDVLDIRILRAMGYAPFQTGARHPDILKPSALADAVGSTAETVRQRLGRMEAAGILRGFEVFPNQLHLGLSQITYHFRVEPSRKPEVMRRLASFDGISGVFDYVGPDMCIDVFYRTPAERDRRVALLQTVAETNACRFYFAAPPQPSRALTHLEWRVVQAMRGRARHGAAELAEVVRVSARTIKRTQERLVQEGAIDIVPLVDPSQIPNFIPIVLAFHFDASSASAAIRAIKHAFEEQSWTSWVPPDAEAGNFDLVAYANSTGEIAQMRERGLAIPGVTKVEVLLPAGGRMNAAWLDEAIAAQVAATAPAVSKSAAPNS